MPNSKFNEDKSYQTVTEPLRSR